MKYTCQGSQQSSSACKDGRIRRNQSAPTLAEQHLYFIACLSRLLIHLVQVQLDTLIYSSLNWLLIYAVAVYVVLMISGSTA